MKKEIWKLIKFSIFGIINVLVDGGLFSFCYGVLRLPTYQSQLMGVSFGLFCSYLLNRRYTFHTENSFFSTELFKFSLVSLFCALISSAGIYELEFTFGLGPWWSKALVTVGVGCINFVLSRLIVFHSLRARRPIRFLMRKVYAFNTLVKQRRGAQIVMVAAIGIAADILMYIYLTSVDLDAYKAQPLCVAGGLVCTYLALLKFMPYKIEHAVGYFCLSVFCTMCSSPIMYLFEVNFGLTAFLAKIPATVVLAAFVYAVGRLIVFRDIFERGD